MRFRAGQPQRSQPPPAGGACWVRFWVLACLLAWIPNELSAVELVANVSENQLKAEFLVKLGLFVEWPAPATNAVSEEPFKIGILGSHNWGSELDCAASSETVGGRPIRVITSKRLRDLDGCRIIFICSSEAKRMGTWLRDLKGRPVLTVADSPGFANRGGMVNFITENGSVRFEINTTAAGQAGLKLSARLLQVSRLVSADLSAGKEGA